jgi:uncharacterized protein YuzE
MSSSSAFRRGDGTWAAVRRAMAAAREALSCIDLISACGSAEGKNIISVEESSGDGVALVIARHEDHAVLSRANTTRFQIAILRSRHLERILIMKMHYDQETDSLYIDLNSRPSTDSREIQEGVVVDFDAKGKIVGIDIQHASEVSDLATFEADSLPVAAVRAPRTSSR